MYSCECERAHLVLSTNYSYLFACIMKGTEVQILSALICINLQACVHVRGYEFSFAGRLLGCI